MSHDIVVIMRSMDTSFKNVRPKLARFVADTYQIPIVSSTETAEQHLRCNHDTIYLLDQSYFFCPFRSELLPLLATAKRVIRLKIEYRFGLDSRVMKHVTETWSNLPGPGVTHVNFNRVAWPGLLSGESPRLQGLLYYGALRPDRLDYMKKYLVTDLYPVTISLNKKKIDWRYQRAMEELGVHPHQVLTCLPSFEGVRDLAKYETTIYLEDVYTHDHYNSPAMRFYEALGAGVTQLFDSSCIPTFIRAGYDILPYVVNTDRDVKRIFDTNVSPMYGRSQRERWTRDYKTELRDELLRLRR